MEQCMHCISVKLGGFVTDRPPLTQMLITLHVTLTWIPYYLHICEPSTSTYCCHAHWLFFYNYYNCTSVYPPQLTRITSTFFLCQFISISLISILHILLIPEKLHVPYSKLCTFHSLCFNHCTALNTRFV